MAFDFSAFRFYRMFRNWPERAQPTASPFVFGPYTNERGNSILDVNGDGHNDIVLFPSYGNIGPHLRPTILLNDGRGGWVRREVSLPGFLPENIHGVSSFSWNGSQYLVAVDQGWWNLDPDPNQLRGSKIWLLKYDQATGSFVDKTDLIPANNPNFNYISWSGDLDSNGKFDILVPAIGANTTFVAGRGLRWLEFGDGVHDRSAELPVQFAYRANATNPPPTLLQPTVGVGDLNRDGFNDLVGVTWGNEGPGMPPAIRIYFGGLQGFGATPLVIAAPDAVIQAQQRLGGGVLGGFQSLIVDTNGDNANDLLVFWEGAGFVYAQALINVNGALVDRTASVLGALAMRDLGVLDANGSFVSSIRGAEIVDVNADGRPDIYLRTQSQGPIDAAPEQAVFWVNDGAGRFQAARLTRPSDAAAVQQIVQATAWETWHRGYIMYGDVTGDGVPDMVTLTSALSDTTTGAGGNLYSNYYDVVTIPGIAPPGLSLTGDGRDNTLIGGAGNDTLKGEGGDDLLRGAAGKDILDGGAGIDTADYSDKTAGLAVILAAAAKAVAKVDGRAEDTISNVENVTGGAGADTITGDRLANRLTGNAGDDTLRGGDGDDVLKGGVGKDILDGGAGVDTADYSDKTISLSVRLAGPTAAAVQAAGFIEDTIKNIENLIAGPGNDTLAGDGLANVLTGGAGDDLLKGGAGKDTLDGGIGIDTADFSDKTAAVSVTLSGATAASVKVGSVVEDTIRNIENVIGGGGADLLAGDSFANMLFGGAGNDVLKGAAGKDTLDGGAGADTADYSDKTAAISVTLAGATAAIVKVGGVGEDTIRNIENLVAGAGNDTLAGDGLANVLTGGAGDDILRGGAGKDMLDGGAGIDTADFADKTTAISVTLSGATAASVKVGSVVEDTIRNIENVVGGSGADVLAGDSLANTLLGGAGNDILRGGAGKDTLDGGAGIDTADFSDKTAAISVTLSGATAVAVKVGSVIEDTIRNIENIVGGAGGDTLTGDGLANMLSGGAGDDVLKGAAGKDTLDGGAGADTADYSDKTVALSVKLSGATAAIVKVGAAGEDTIKNIENLVAGTGNDTLTGDGLANALAGGAGDDLLRGGAGKDTLDGGAGIDTADFADKTASVSVTLSGATAAAVKVGGVIEDTIRNIENVIGGSAGDLLTGDGLANTLLGGAGDDVLKGAAGKDTLDGGAGIDTADYSDKTAAISVTLAGATAVTVKVGAGNEDTLRNIENLTGGTGSDTLIGDGLANLLVGGAGHDTLNGGAGKDTLTGGAGRDQFVFTSRLNASTNVDRITDFNVTDDTIQLDHAVFTTLAPGSVLAAAAFFAGTAAHDADDRIIYDSATGALFYDANGSAAGGSVQFAQLSPNLAVTFSDFRVI